MILDTSALIAILYGEPEGPSFIDLIEAADVCRMSVANFVELSMVVQRQLGTDAAAQTDRFLQSARVIIEPVTMEQGLLARQAFLDFGKGCHRSGPNFGDCFRYALARARGESLKSWEADSRGLF